MREWKIQRPSTLWIEATVKADTLDDALEEWEKKFADGQTEEKHFEINFDEFWAEDDKGQIYG